MRTLVRHAMTAPVFSVHPDMSLETLERELTKRHIGGAPVVVDGEVVGIVTKSDIVRQLGLDRVLSGVVVDYLRKTAVLPSPAQGHLRANHEDEERVARAALGGQLRAAKVADCMVTTVHTASASQELSAAACVMAHEGVHRLPVLEDGKLVGILTAMDVLRQLASGEIAPDPTLRVEMRRVWEDVRTHIKHWQAPREQTDSHKWRQL